MAFKDLRDFLNYLESKGDLLRIKEEVDWNEEAGALGQETLVRKAPAFVLENIKDYKDKHGKKIAMNTMATPSRINAVLGLPEEAGPREMVKLFKKRGDELLKPTVVSGGPCKEVIHKEGDINILEFPVPRLHAKDGGRYIGTWHGIVTKDPYSDWTNIGMYRAMVHDEKSIGLLWIPTQHWGLMGLKYRAMGKPMPLAIIIGGDPSIVWSATSTVAMGVCEYDLAGAIRQEPLELVKCETIDLLVPANVEIVIEGTMSLDPKTFRPEGPFGEYPGRYTSLWSEPRPVMNVTCVTHRSDPILQCTSMGTGPDLTAGEGDWLAAIAMSATVWKQLEMVGIPGITAVWQDPDAGPTNVFVSINNLYYGHARQVASAIWGLTFAPNMGKYTVVVDSDVDIYNLKKINAALAYRTQPEKDVVIYKGAFGAPLDPSVHPDTKRRLGGMGKWDRVLIDATWSLEWEPREEWGGLRHPPSCLAEENSLEIVRKKWKQYGFTE